MTNYFSQGVRVSLLCAVSLGLCSCAVTSVKETWKSPEVQRPATKIAVLGIDDRSLVRQGVENRLVNQLIEAGTPASTTFDKLSLAQIKEDKRAAGDAFVAAGADTILILRLMDSAISYREIQPGRERYVGTVTGVDYSGWYNYYSIGYESLTATYASMKQYVYLEAVLFDLKAGKRLWSAVTKSVLEERTDRAAEADPLAKKIVGAMRKDGMIK
jgi:hypothetical protein